MAFTRKVQALGLFLMHFTRKIIYAGFHHQTLSTQHTVSSFLEITGKSLFRLLNSLALLFHPSLQETQSATTYAGRTENNTQLRPLLI